MGHFQAVYDKTTDPDTKVSAMIQMADVNQESGHLGEAAAVYQRVVQAYPNNPMMDYVQYRQAIAFLKAEKIDAALASFKALQANFPDSKYLEDMDYYRGVISFKKGNWSKASVTMDHFLK